MLPCTCTPPIRSHDIWLVSPRHLRASVHPFVFFHNHHHHHHHHPLFLSLCHRINFVFRDLVPPPRNCNVARSVCLHNFLHFRVARLPSYPIPSLSLFPDPSSPIYVYLFLFIFNVSSVWQAAYSDFVSSRSRESSCHFSFSFFFSNLLELSSPNPSSPLVGNYICIRSPRGEDRDLTSF